MIARDGRLRQHLRHVGKRAPETKRDGNQNWLSAQMPCKHLEQHSVGVDARSAELNVRGWAVCIALAIASATSSTWAGCSSVWPRPNSGKMGKRRNILATGVTKASPRPNITEGRMSATAGKASRTTISPSPRLRTYGEEDPASEPMPETWINCLTPASRASGATLRLLLHGRNGRSVGRSPHRDSRRSRRPPAATAAATERSSLMSAWIDSMPSRTSGKRAAVRSGCRDVTRIENSQSSKCWTTWRPRKPVPPNTVTFPRTIVPFPRRCSAASPHGGRLAARSAKRQVRLIVTRRVLKQTPSLCGRMGGFDRLDDFEPFEFRVAEGERLALASVLMGGAELFRLGPCRKILLRRPYCMR